MQSSINGQQANADELAALRRQVARIEGRANELGVDAAGDAWRFGLSPLDAAAGGGLRRDRLHVFRPAGAGGIVATQGVQLALAAVAASAQATLLWVTTAAHAQDWGRLYSAGLSTFGFASDRLLVIEARQPAEAAWAVEEGLRSRAFAAVLASGLALDFSMSRRLAVVAADCRCPCLATDAPLNQAPLASASLWRVTPRPSQLDPYDPAAVGALAWSLELLRVRGGPPAGPWEVSWNEASHHFALVSAIADRSLAPAAPPQRRDVAESFGVERGRAARA